MAAPDRQDDLAPALRASDVDRERAAERLRTAATHGQLDIDELDERLTAAFAARTRAELAPLTADLPDVADHDAIARASFDGPVVRPGGAGEAWIVSVMGGHDREGRWRLGPRVRVVNVMGGSDLDLTEAELSAPITELTVVSIMGGSAIHVPDGVHVEITRFGLMGGNDVDLGTARAPDGAPVLRVRLFALMGGNDVKRGPKRSRRDKRLERRQHEALDERNP